MKINLSPTLSDGALSLIRDGDALIINGVRLDFSAIPDGFTLPRDAVGHDTIASDVIRINGQIELTLVLPYAPGAGEDVTFPAPIHVAEDGPISAPGLAVPVDETAVGQIDMAKAIDLTTEPVPASVSRFQARAALLLAGRMPAVETAIKAADPMTQLAWADAQVFRRDSASIATIAAAMKMTDAEVDDLFRAAVKIEA